MSKTEVCPKCGVPRAITNMFTWKNNGIISIAGTSARMVFYECGNIDNVFRGVEELIGAPIEHIVLERKRRDTRRFMKRVLPEPIERLEAIFNGTKLDRVSSVDPTEKSRVLEIGEAFTAAATGIGMVYGYGDIRFSKLWELWDTFPWRTQIIRKPYSVIFFSADMLAAVEAFERRDMAVEYEQVADDVYLFSVIPGEHPIELADRLKRKTFEIKPGDISHERCPECDVPLLVARCHWDLQMGTIIDPDTGRRMAFFDPAAVDTVFDDLEAELGEEVPEAIIEAQRRYGKRLMSSGNYKRSGYDFKTTVAARGLGNITAFKADDKRLSLTMENPSMHLGMVGMIIALYELAWGAEISTHEWHRTDDGDLVVTVEL
jgi:hypothetical protein